MTGTGTSISIKTCEFCWRLKKNICPRTPPETDPDATECEIRTCERIAIEGLLYVIGKLEDEKKPRKDHMIAKCRFILRRIGVYDG